MQYIRSAALVALSILVFALSAQAQGFSITNYQKVSQQDITPTKSNVTYRADLVNSGAAFSSVIATVTGQDPFAVRVVQGQDMLNFSPVPANSQVTSNNTFTIQIDPTVPFDFASKLQWTYQTAAGGPIANAGLNQTGTVGATVRLDGSGSSNPSGIGTLSYSWVFTSLPAGSQAFLGHPNSVMPSFVIDVQGNYVITLTVSNGTGSSSASVTISTFHTKPVANAGQNQTVGQNATVVLNGSNSNSPDGRPLTYAWTLTSIPAGSTAVLTGANTVSPSFVADKSGTYMAQLIVNDGLASGPSTVAIVVGVVKPVANAGPNQLVNINTVVHLTGAGSTDANGLPLTYQWSLITLPAGSSASLTNPATVNPTFVADQQGVYVAQLIVNNGAFNSDPSTVTITTQTPLGPTANAGPNQTVTLGSTVQLSGSGTDPQNLPLTYQWTLTSKPAGSTASLSSGVVQNPIFTADVSGKYIAQLIVNNGTQSSAPSTVTISTTCSQPTANPGQPQTVGVGATVLLSGSGSGDVCNDPLTYSWSFTTRPAGSAATLSGATTVAPTFVADVAGMYVVQLIVNNGNTNSNPATVSITASTGLGIVFFQSSLSLTTSPASDPLILSSPAPAGGQVVTLTSSNPSVATAPATVTVDGGQVSVSVPITPGTVSGTTIITASAPGYASGTVTVTVALPTLSITLDSQTIGLSNTINGVISLSTPAASGATVIVTASPGGIVDVQPVSVTIAPGGNTGAFTLRGVAVGGPVTLTASTPGYNSGSTQVTVASRGAIVLPATFLVAPNQTATYPVSLVTGAPVGGVTIQLASSDPSKVTVSPSVFIPFKATVPDIPAQVTGVNGGTATITATAPGFVPGVGTVTVANPAITITLDSSTVGISGTINGVITLTMPAPSALTVTVSANPSGIVTVQPASVAIAAGGTTGNFTVTGAAIGGPVTITASAPGYTTGSASVSVGSGGLGKITLPSNVTVGTNQSVPFPVVLQTGAPVGGVTVTLSNSDPTKLTLSTSSVFIPFKSTTPATQPQVTGVSFGSATISASAPGFTGDSQVVQVTAVLSLTPSSLALVLGATQNITLNLSSPAPAGGLTVNLSSSDPTKVSVPSTVSFAANTSQVPVAVTGVALGSVTLTASAPNLTSGSAGINVLSLGQITLPANVVAAPQGQTVAFPISLSSNAQSGGVTVTLVSSDPSRVTVTSSVVIPQGSNTPATQPQVVGVNIGTATITATAVGFSSASQLVKVPGALTFSPGSLTFNGGTTQNFVLNLSPAAPPGGLTIALSSDNTAVATVPSSVTFSPGSISVAFAVTGVSAGVATIHASALPSVPDATGTVTIQVQGSILLPANVSLVQGQSAPAGVTLSTAAPAGGVTISLASSDTSKVTVSPASVFIAQGAVSPASQPQVTGVNPGSAAITATAPGWSSASQTVQVTSLTMSFSPASQTIGVGTQNFALNLSAPAPAGGLTVSLSSNNTAVASVPPTVSFTAGASSVNVAVTGVGPGSATITASAPNIASAAASVTVLSDMILPANVTVAPGNVAPFPVTLTKPAPAGGVFITLTSSNPQVLTVSPVNVFIPQGGMVSNQPQVTGVSNGSATVTAMASGLAPASQVVFVGTGPSLTMSFSPGSLTLNGGATQSLNLILSGPAPAGGLVVSLNSNNTGIATVPSSVSIGAGASSVGVPVTGIAGAGGQTTITASASGIPSAFATVTVNGTVLPGISVSSVSVGVGQSVGLAVTLGAAAPAGGLTVSLVSGDPSKATVTSSVFFAAGAATASAQVTGVSAGSATITASAAGYTSGSGTVTVAATGGSSSFSPASLTVNTGSPGNITLNLSAPAPAGGVTANLISSNTGVATVPASVFIAQGAAGANVTVTGVGAGSATITANTPNFGSAIATITVTGAPPPGIILPNITTLQLGQTVPFPVMLSTPALSGGVFITLSSSDTNKATVQPANVFIAQGLSGSNQPTLTGITVGTVTISASASGFATVSQQIQVVSGSSLGLSPGNITLTTGASQNLVLTLPSPAPGGGQVINLSSSNPGVASVPSTVTVPSFGSSVNVLVTAGTPGSATITASAPGFGSATAGVTVTGAAPFFLPANVTLAPGDTVPYPVTLSSPAPAGGAFVTLSSSDTSKVTISPGAFFIAEGQTSSPVTPKITGAGFGTAAITAQATGVGMASGLVTVGSSASFQPASLVIQGTAFTKSLTLALTSPAPAGGLVVNLSSSDTAVITVPSTVTIPANFSSVNVPVTSVAPGSASVQASSLPVFPATAATVTVVSAPSVILPEFQTVGIRNSAPLPVSLSAPAPAGGVTVFLTSSDTSKFTVTASVFIAAGATTPATTPIITGGDFISSEGFANVTATATGYAAATLQMHIGDAITISIPSNLTVGVGQSIPLPVALPGMAPAGGVTLTITSSNPGVATVTANVFIPAGQNMPSPLPVLTGVQPGTVTIDAAASGYTSGAQLVQVK